MRSTAVLSLAIQLGNDLIGMPVGLDQHCHTSSI